MTEDGAGKQFSKVAPVVLPASTTFTLRQLILRSQGSALIQLFCLLLLLFMLRQPILQSQGSALNYAALA